MERFILAFGGIPMDDYHKFYDAHEAYIEEWHMN
jgi:hypothetical protein